MKLIALQRINEAAASSILARRPRHGGPGRRNVRRREASAQQPRCNRNRGLSLMPLLEVNSGTEKPRRKV
jgi:hypothetical protein